MNHRFWLFKRKGVYYVQDALTRKKEGLKTSDRKETERLRFAKNEAHDQPMLNLALGRTYLSAKDPALLNRTWSMAMEKLCAIGRESTRIRKRRELDRMVYDPLRKKRSSKPPTPTFTMSSIRGARRRTTIFAVSTIWPAASVGFLGKSFRQNSGYQKRRRRSKRFRTDSMKKSSTRSIMRSVGPFTHCSGKRELHRATPRR
jgi:hypothetical protein